LRNIPAVQSPPENQAHKAWSRLRTRQARTFGSASRPLFDRVGSQARYQLRLITSLLADMATTTSAQRITETEAMTASKSQL
jgi:hypothetical protein